MDTFPRSEVGVSDPVVERGDRLIGFDVRHQKEERGKRKEKRGHNDGRHWIAESAHRAVNRGQRASEDD